MNDFSPAAIADFAALSGDRNPLHVDALSARRLMFGRPVAHGIYLALWALDRWLQGRGARRIALVQLRAEFKAPLAVGAHPTLAVAADGEGAVKLRVEVDGQRVCVIGARFVDAGPRPGLQASSQASSLCEPWTPPHALRPEDDPLPDAFPPEAPCRERTLAEIHGASGAALPCLPRALAARQFSSLFASVPAWQIASLAATTRVVGMECPGLHSVYSELDARFEERGGGEIAWRVDDFDERVNRLRLRFSGGGFSAEVAAFVRPPPRAQRSTAELRALVAPGAHAGRRALIVGGSRGLGEVAAKMLAASGAEVAVTYHRGADDARRVVDDIASAGLAARSLALDVSSPPDDLAARLGPGWVPDQLYYFASPPIFVAASGRFSPALFHDFCACYVDGFLALIQAVLALGSGRLSAFYPSSVAVDQTPPNMGEYAAAKAAGEALCRFLATTQRRLGIVVERLPRLATDQTASLLSTGELDPVPVIQRVLSRMAAVS